MRVGRRTWAALFTVLLVVGAVRLGLSGFRQALVGPRHEFVLADRPALLNESLALAKAKEALALDGLDAAEWKPHPDGRTVAPDGRRDEYLVRNGLNPNSGWITFRTLGGQTRFVSVELAGDRVICQLSKGK